MTHEELILANKFGLAQRLSHHYLVLLEDTNPKFRLRQIYNRAIKANDQLSDELSSHGTKEIFDNEGIMTDFLMSGIDLLMYVAMSRNKAHYEAVLAAIAEEMNSAMGKSEKRSE